jgi:peroxiredoxin
MRGRGKLLVTVTIASLVAGLVGLLAWRMVAKEEGKGLAAAAAAGERPVAPDFELERLDGDGGLSLTSLRGQVVVLNFWASWCPPCQSETPVLRDLAERYADRGLVVIGVSVQETNAADVRSYAERYQLGYTIAPDLSGDIFRLYRLYGLPTQFFVGTDGAIRSVILAPLDEASAEAQIQAILPESSPRPSPSPSPSP